MQEFAGAFAHRPDAGLAVVLAVVGPFDPLAEEDFGGAIEIDAALLLGGGALGRVPFELHTAILRASRSPGKRAEVAARPRARLPGYAAGGLLTWNQAAGGHP